MFFSEDRRSLRASFVDAWQKRRDGTVLSALEDQIAAVVMMHDEYHALLDSGEGALHRDFDPEDGVANPFLHMALHLAVRDQVATDRPPGIRDAYEHAAAKSGDRHAAEHLLLECLAETLWQAQRDGRVPDEGSYLQSVEAQLRK
jgi:hypothetical protein